MRKVIRAKEEMAEQFPEKGGKIPAFPRRLADVGFQATPPAWAPQKCKGARPLPSHPDRTGVSLGFFAFPFPRPGEHSPGTPILTNLCLFLQVPLPPPHRSWGLIALQKPSLRLHQVSLAPWHPLGSQLSRPMSPPASPCPQPWPKAARDPGVPLEGTAGAAGSPLRHTRCPWAAGVGGGLVGTLRGSRRRASSSAVPGLTAGAGVRALPLQPAPPGLG